MRRIFIIATKLLGLSQLFLVLTQSLSLMLILKVLAKDGNSIYIMIGVMAGILFVTISLIFAGLLVLRTEYIADLLHISDDREPASLQYDQLLYIGVKLIGLYIFIRGIPSLAKAVFLFKQMMDLGRFMWSGITPPLVQLLIGVLVLIFTQPLLKLITLDSKK